MDEKTFMKRALELARLGTGRVSPNPMVGAVLEKEGRIVGEGYHQRAGADHAEVAALKQAGDAARGATLYVTLEPCCHHGKTPPCTDAIIQSGIRRVVAALEDPNPRVNGKGRTALERAGIPVTMGLLEDEARRLNESYFHWRATRRPFLVAKWAMTLDGRVATTTGSSRYLTSEEALTHAHSLRATYDAVMVGVGTVLADDPLLTVRRVSGRNPRRIIVDTRLRTPPTAACLHEEGETMILAAEWADPEPEKRLRSAGATIIRLPPGEGGLDLSRALVALGEAGITSALVEGGPTLTGSLFTAGALAKYMVYVAPKLLGGAGALGPIGGAGIAEAALAKGLRCHPPLPLGPDFLIEAYPQGRES